MDKWELQTRNRWYNHEGYLHLYHGTSSCFVDKIRSSGLSATPNGKQRIEAVAALYGIQLDQKIQKYLSAQWSFGWTDNDSYVCLSPSQLCAAGYAEHNHYEGGEFNKMLKYHLKRATKKKLLPLYPNSFAVVIEILLPIGEVKDLTPDIKSFKRLARDLEKEDDPEAMDLFGKGMGEIRLPTVKPHNICRIMRVPSNA